MTSVKFLADREMIYGFSLSGHCSVDGDDEIGRIVCAAVSSAAYMTANTITEVIGDKAEIEVSDALMCLKTDNPSDATLKVLEGFRLHIKELANQYSNNLKINGGAENVTD